MVTANLAARFCSTWLLGQAVKTSPFHGGNTGSIPVGVIHHLGESLERFTDNGDLYRSI